MMFDGEWIRRGRMGRVITACVMVGLFVATSAPTALSDGTDSKPYIAFGGGSQDHFYVGAYLDPERPPGCPDDLDCPVVACPDEIECPVVTCSLCPSDLCVEVLGVESECLAVGGARLRSDHLHQTVVVSIDDLLTASNAPFSVCPDEPDYTIGPYLDAECTGADCGPRVLFVPPEEAFEVATVFVFNVLITHNLDICLGTTGTVTGEFFY